MNRALLLTVIAASAVACSRADGEDEAASAALADSVPTAEEAAAAAASEIDAGNAEAKLEEIRKELEK